VPCWPGGRGLDLDSLPDGELPAAQGPPASRSPSVPFPFGVHPARSMPRLAFLSPAQYGHLGPMLCLIDAFHAESDVEVQLFTTGGTQRHRRADCETDADADADAVAGNSESAAGSAASATGATAAWRPFHTEHFGPDGIDRIDERHLPPLAKDFHTAGRRLYHTLAARWTDRPETRPDMLIADHCCFAAVYLSRALNIPLALLFSNIYPIPSRSLYEPDLYDGLVSSAAHRASLSAVFHRWWRLLLLGRDGRLYHKNAMYQAYRHFGRTIDAPATCHPTNQAVITLVNSTRILHEQRHHDVPDLHYIGPLVKHTTGAGAGAEEIARDLELASLLGHDDDLSSSFLYISFGTLVTYGEDVWRALLEGCCIAAARAPMATTTASAEMSRDRKLMRIVVSAPSEQHPMIRRLWRVVRAQATDNATDLDAARPAASCPSDHEEQAQLPGLEEDGLLLRHWWPQSDLLASSRLVAFVTHAGNSSLLEAMVRGVVLVAVPCFVDQPVNAERARALGFAEVLDEKQRRHPHAVSEAIRRVREEPKYREAARRIQATYRHHATHSRAHAVQLVREQLFLASAAAPGEKTPGVVHAPQAPPSSRRRSNFLLLAALAAASAVVVAGAVAAVGVVQRSQPPSDSGGR